MNVHNFKITWRLLLKAKLFTVVNIFGLAIGFAGFVLAYLYINYESSYDSWNLNYENIYLVGLEGDGLASDLTPASLGTTIKEQLPEIAELGRVREFPYEVAFHSNEQVFFIKHWLGADVSFAKMFGIESKGSDLDSISNQAVFLNPAVATVLFPKAADIQGKWVMMGNKNEGLPLQLSGVTKAVPGLSNIEFDCLGLVEDLEPGMGNNADVQTFIQVKPGTNIKLLSAKLNEVFKGTVAKATENIFSSIENKKVYLDPLKNLHLRPKHGSSTGYKIVIALSLLSSIILILAGINFANLMIVQAQKRAKEIGMKKIFGITPWQLMLQLFSEVFIQCFSAACIALFLVSIIINILVKNFGYDLTAFEFNETILYQLFAAVVLTSFISGLYPAIILSGNKSIRIIKGNYQVSYKTNSFRNILLAFQFVIAFGFISVMIVIHKQMDFIKTADPGFSSSQVVYIKNLVVFNEANEFSAIRDRMKTIPGIEAVSVATNFPGGHPPVANDFEYLDRKQKLDHVGVDFEYFETLNMDILEGRFFSSEFPVDSINSAILNEAAVKTFGLTNPIGAIIRGCDTEFQVVGIVKDSKTQGFEELVRPTVYSIKNTCMVSKVEILAKIAPGKIQASLGTLKKEWNTINKKDSGHFIYEFLDQKYAALYAKQEQLQRAFTAFTVLIILVALMGLFSMAAYSISIRRKEVGIRKILGASGKEILLLLNKPFLKLVGLAILISTPIAWWLSNRWLQSFAYRINMEWWYFLLGAVFCLVIAFITVSIQVVKATYLNPVDVLHEE